MKDRIRLSEVASYYLKVVKQRLNLYGQPNYVPMRIAFGRSLQMGKGTEWEETDPEIIAKAKSDRGGEQPQLPIFEQGQGLFFQVLLSQQYRRKVEGDDYVDLLTEHVEHGLWLLFRETEKLKGYDYLVAIASQAQRNLKGGSPETIHAAQWQEPTNPGVLNIRIGVQKKTQDPILYAINTANNPHMGIMGGTGSGKTYFLKHLLRQIRHQSDYETHFLIFDYAKGDIAGDQQFLKDTRATLVDVKRKPLPLNIYADAARDEQEQRRRAEKIVGIFKNVEASFGKVQEENLYNAILDAYSECEPYPDFDAIRERVLSITDGKPDTLTSILRPLVEQNYFARSGDPIWSDWSARTTVVDIHQIERKDLVCFLVLEKVFSELKALGDAPVNAASGARRIRTVVVLDEAHNFLGVPKRAKILETMIREIRSMGGMVVLASQSPDDYNTANFDFLELLEFPIVLKSTPQSHKFLEQKFSLTAGQAKEVGKEVGKLERGEAFAIFDKKTIQVELCK